MWAMFLMAALAQTAPPSLSRGLEFLRDGKLADAERDLRSVLALDPAAADIQHLMGIVISQQDRPAEAAPFFEKAVELNSREPKLQYNLALNRLQTGRVQQALDPLRMAIARDPDNAQILLTLTQVQLRLEDRAEASRSARMLLALPSVAPQIVGELAVALAKARVYPEAAAAFKRLPPSPPTMHDLALVHRELGETTEAVAALRRALRGESGNTAFAFDLGLALIQDGSIGEAQTLLADYSQRYPDNARLMLGLGIAAYMGGANEEARRLFSRAVAVEPDSAGLHLALADFLYGNGQHAEAAESYGRAMTLDSTDAALRAKAGRNTIRLRQADRARKLFEEALHLDPAQVEARYELARLLASDGREQEAMMHFERALATDPNLAPAHYQLLLLYRKTGQTEKAERALLNFRRLSEKH